MLARPALAPPSPEALLRRSPAIPSNSSRKIIVGLDCLAFLKISRIFFSDSPAHLDISCGPLMDMKFALASLAIAVAIRVLPVPGGPKMRKFFFQR